MKERLSNIELLRFLCMFSICILHMFVHGKDLMGILSQGSMISDGKAVEELVILCLCFPSVCCFMYISGYFGLKLSSYKLFTLFFQASFYFYIVFLIQKMIGMGGVMTIKEMLLHFEPISTHVWWFLTEYVCIFLLSPLINQGISNISRATFGKSLCVLLFINCVGLYITSFHSGSSLLGMLAIYLIGRYVRMYSREYSIKRWLSCFFILISLEFIGVVGAYFFVSSSVSWRLLWYCNPIVIGIGISLFHIFKSLPVFHSKIINWLGKHCLSIYLVTEISKPIYNYWASLYDSCFILSFLAILVTCLCIVGFDVVQQKASSYIYKIFIKKRTINEL